LATLALPETVFWDLSLFGAPFFEPNKPHPFWVGLSKQWGYRALFFQASFLARGYPPSYKHCLGFGGGGGREHTFFFPPFGGFFARLNGGLLPTVFGGWGHLGGGGLRRVLPPFPLWEIFPLTTRCSHPRGGL